MKVEVKERFIDKHTDQVHHVGDILEVTEERLAEIQNVSDKLVQVIHEQEQKTVPEEPMKKSRSRKKGTE